MAKHEKMSLKTPALEHGMGESWLEFLWNQGKKQVRRGRKHEWGGGGSVAQGDLSLWTPPDLNSERHQATCQDSFRSHRLFSLHQLLLCLPLARPGHTASGTWNSFSSA